MMHRVSSGMIAVATSLMPGLLYFLLIPVTPAVVVGSVMLLQWRAGRVKHPGGELR
jgi:hypothetical protein